MISQTDAIDCRCVGDNNKVTAFVPSLTCLMPIYMAGNNNNYGIHWILFSSVKTHSENIQSSNAAGQYDISVVLKKYQKSTYRV